MSSKSAATIIAAGLLLILWYGFDLRRECLLQGLDGNVWRINLEVQAEFRTPYGPFVTDPLQGMFDAYFPAYREYLAPYFLALVAGVESVTTSFVYFAYSALAMLAVFLLARSVAIGTWPSLLAGFLLPVTTMPLFSQSILYPIMGLNPHVQQMLALSMLVIACFWAMGGKSRYCFVVLALTAIGCTVLAALGTVSLIALMVPAIAIYGGASLLDETSWRSRRPKLLGAIAVIIVPIVLGIVHYIYALSKYTAFAYFSDEFEQSRASSYFASVAWQPAVWGPVLVLGGLGGAAFALWLGPRRLRLFAATHIAATVLFQAAALAIVRWAPSYQGPSPLYFEIFFWPINLIFIAYLASSCAAALFGWLGARKAGEALPLVVMGLIVFTTVRTDDAQCVITDLFQPRDDNAIVRHLIDSVQLVPGGPYRGSVATFVGDAQGTPATWFAEHGADGESWRSIGNDMRSAGLWKYRIPTLFQYNTFITPTYYRLTTSLLARPIDHQMRSVLVLTDPRESILKLLGVRFMIVDHEPGFGRSVAEVTLKGDRALRLVEIADPNVGNYSPTRAIVLKPARDILDAVANKDFDGRRDIVVDRPFEQPLVAAASSQLTVVKDGLRISAESRGRSVIVLPIQFSRCWELESASGARLLRANFAQLGVEFEGHLEGKLNLRFGPFWNSLCRIHDIRDADEMDLRSTRGAMKNHD